MRSLGVVLAPAFVAGLAAWGLQQRGAAIAALDIVAAERVQILEAERATPIRAQASIAVRPAGLAPAAPTPRAAPAQEAPVVQERPRSSRQRGPRRSRSRNRYPGPIPTPAEWEAPAGPVRIALQAGHWRASEAPAELSGLKDNGTSHAGVPEWEVNLEIVREAARQLRDLGYEVDVLPAVVPPGYRAHLFIAVHADGSADPSASGYRVAAPRRDATGRASQFVDILQREYGEETSIQRLPDVTRRMQSYYAFNFRRYEHALHPMTIGVILETGFLTSARDRRVIVDRPEVAAKGIVEAVKAFPITAVTKVADAG